jgi:hypothetical protein
MHGQRLTDRQSDTMQPTLAFLQLYSECTQKEKKSFGMITFVKIDIVSSVSEIVCVCPQGLYIC